jgi:hypothetical protein
MPGGGTWNSSSPPARTGAYFNFSAALQAAISSGVVGTTVVIGTGDWGLVGGAREITGNGDYNAEYGVSTNGTLRDGVLGALDGFDDGGAGRVLAMRVAGSAKVKGTCVLDDGSAVDALTLTAKYEGARANNFHFTVQTNAVNGSNKDLILYESGVELERWENVTGGTNSNFVTAINTTAPSKFITAAVAGAGARALANIVGVIGGTGAIGTVGGGVAGNSGLTITSADVVAALGVVGNQVFDTIALANITDDTTLDAFVAWLRDRNETGKRCFGVIGGAAAELMSAAKTRATEYDGAATYRQAALNLVNLGFTDLRRLSDDVVLSTALLAPRFAGHLAAVGFTRDMTNVRWTGYQVNTVTTPSNFVDAQNSGVVMFDNDTTTRVSIESGVNSLITTNADTRHPAMKEIRNVAIMHFIENTLSRVAKDLYLGSLANDEAGRKDLVGSFGMFLKDLEALKALQPGQSEVVLDDTYQQTGDAVYLRYGVKFQGVVKRIFSTVQIGN